MTMIASSIEFSLPDWLVSYAQTGLNLNSLEKRMRFVIGAAEKNVLNKGGGPFAAAIFETESNKLVSLGVNLVTSHNNAILHAEVVAIMLAQKKLNSFDLARADFPQHELVSSSEPCAMCIGATHWSGVKQLAFGAKVADAEEVGFNEGPISNKWKPEFSKKGIDIFEEILRDEAIEVLKLYKDHHGTMYNASGLK